MKKKATKKPRTPSRTPTSKKATKKPQKKAPILAKKEPEKKTESLEEAQAGSGKKLSISNDNFDDLIKESEQELNQPIEQETPPDNAGAEQMPLDESAAPPSSLLAEQCGNLNFQALRLGVRQTKKYDLNDMTEGQKKDMTSAWQGVFAKHAPAILLGIQEELSILGVNVAITMTNIKPLPVTVTPEQTQNAQQ